MQLSRLDMATRIRDARGQLLHQIELLTRPADAPRIIPGNAPLCVTIDGQRQDDTIVELVRGHVVAELRARVRRCDADLRQLGVAVD